MADSNADFQAQVEADAGLGKTDVRRDCYGASNPAKFVNGGFLCGTPNIESLGTGAGALCVFSKIGLGPGTELHVALLIRKGMPDLLKRLAHMVAQAGTHFSDKNNNCALYLYSDGLVYPNNKGKGEVELTPEVVKALGPGIAPDALYYAVTGDQEAAADGQVKALRALVGEAKLKRMVGTVATPDVPAIATQGPDLGGLVKSFLGSSKMAHVEITERSAVRFAASLLSKRFLILTGLAGSGKTKSAQAFARWITPAPGWVDDTDHEKGRKANPHYALIPVGADWSGNENIVGYPDGLAQENYVTTPALEVIRHAQQPENAELPHFLILDEMNLSHVERYFADVLSAIESQEAIHLYQGAPRKANGEGIPRNVVVPSNLFIIGTVNVDESTYMFSPKVLDRANVIEFRMDEQELGDFLDDPIKPDISLMDGRGAAFGKTFVVEANGPAHVPGNMKATYKSEMLLFFGALQKQGAEFGYRTAHEAARFIHYYRMLGGYPDNEAVLLEAFDCIVVQKFLPKLHGSRAKLGPLLKALWFLCTKKPGDARGSEPAQAVAKAGHSTGKLDEPSPDLARGMHYELSANKIARMWQLLKDNGFASFAEA